MRVLLLNNNIPGHGAWFRALHAARFFRARGHRVTLVSSGRNLYRARHGALRGIDIWQTPSWAPFLGLEYGWSVPGVMWRMGLAATAPWDIVWAFSHKPVDQYPARLARSLRRATWISDWCDLWGGEHGISRLHWKRDGNPLVEAMRSTIFDGDDRLERTAALDCDALTVIGGDLKLRSKVWGRHARTALLRNGCNTAAIRPLDRAECRRRLDLPQDVPIAGYVSNYQPDEDFLLDALRVAHRRLPSARFLLRCPKFREGDRALRRRGLEDCVLWYDRQPHGRLCEIMGACDLLLVPMEDNDFNRSRIPHKISDAMAGGRAQLACAVGDVPDIFAEHGLGATCPAEPKAFGERAAELLADRAACESYGRNGRDAAETSFQWDTLIGTALDGLGVRY